MTYLSFLKNERVGTFFYNPQKTTEFQRLLNDKGCQGFTGRNPSTFLDKRVR
jgi:hypothetical protein